MGKKLTKKERAYKLLDAGHRLDSPEVKKIGKPSSLRTYYYRWKLDRGITTEGTEELSETTVENKGVTTKLGPGERIAVIKEKEPPVVPAQSQSNSEVLWEEDLSKEEERRIEKLALQKLAELAAVEPDGNGEKPSADDGKKEKEKAPSGIIGEGLAIQVKISVKSMALFEDARHRIFVTTGEKILLGDFVDTCIEDFYKGRGMDLGIVQLAEVKDE